MNRNRRPASGQISTRSLAPPRQRFKYPSPPLGPSSSAATISAPRDRTPSVSALAFFLAACHSLLCFCPLPSTLCFFSPPGACPDPVGVSLPLEVSLVSGQLFFFPFSASQ